MNPDALTPNNLQWQIDQLKGRKGSPLWKAIELALARMVEHQRQSCENLAVEGEAHRLDRLKLDLLKQLASGKMVDGWVSFLQSQLEADKKRAAEEARKAQAQQDGTPPKPKQPKP